MGAAAALTTYDVRVEQGRVIVSAEDAALAAGAFSMPTTSRNVVTRDLPSSTACQPPAVYLRTCGQGGVSPRFGGTTAV